MSPIASASSAVSTNLGSSRTKRRTLVVIAVDAERVRAGGPATMMPRASSDLGRDDLLPQLSVLLLVFGPDLFLCDLFESRDVGVVDSHALGLKQFLGLREVIDALDQLPDALLRDTA